MNYLYSAQTNSFYLEQYPEGADIPFIPEDVVLVPEARWKELTNTTEIDKVLIADQNGYPILVERTEIPPSAYKLTPEE